MSWTPTKGQMKFLSATAPIKVLACGRRWGKSEVAARIIFFGCLGRNPLRQIILAPSYDQSRIIFEKTLFMLKGETTAPFIATYNPYPKLTLKGGFVSARSAVRDGMYLRGQGAERVVVDEAAYVPERVVREVVLPMLAETNGELILLSTPRGRNYFYELFMEGKLSGNEVWSYRGASYENFLIPRGFFERQKQVMAEIQYKTEFEAAFIENNQRVFKQEWVDNALMLNMDYQLRTAPIVVGVDWARYRDYTALIAVRGSLSACKIIHCERFNGMSWSEQIDRVAQWCLNNKPMAVVCDRTSIGDPLLEQLRKQIPRIGIEGVVFTHSNKRQMIEQVALMLERQRLELCPEMDLLRELYYFNADVGKSGAVRLNASYGYHDDMVIALALAVSGLPNSLEPPRISSTLNQR